jgi:TonB family protein
MRVLVVDQDSASNLAITRSLREQYTVDCVTNKGAGLDLLRSNTFEVIVATERLEDGSGLELLGQVSKKWPSVRRIFAADPDRLQLLRGRLGPFRLFQTLTYPIDPDRLVATLELATAVQNGEAETPALEPEAFPAPQPAERAAPEEQVQAASGGRRASGRATSARQSRSTPGQRSRGSSTVGEPVARAGSGSSRRRGGTSGSRNDTSTGRGIDAPPTFAGSGTIGPRGSKATPVRFPPLKRTRAPERPSPAQAPQKLASRRSGSDSSAEAAAIAQATRSTYEASSDEFDTRRLAVMVGGGLAVVVAAVFLSVKMFGSKSAILVPAPAVAHAPQYPKEVNDLIAQTESAFKADDFKTARADVDRLRQLAPSHPRLGFFEGLLTARADNAAKGGGVMASANRGVSNRKNGKSPAPTTTSSLSADAGSASTGLSTPLTGTSAPASGPDGSLQGTPALPPEAPVGFSRGTADANDAQHSTAAATVPGATAPTAATSAVNTMPAPAVGTSSANPITAATPSPSASAANTASAGPTHQGSGEPPPVIREAKLIRRVNPDYPSAARKESITGSVDLEVTVSSEGVVENVSVVQASPPGLFDKSALIAVRKWKYDPRFVDGLPSQARLKVHLDFGPNQ